MRVITYILFFLAFTLSGCRFYSFTGASISGKTINVRTLENKAMNVVPSLSPTLSEKIRSRIISQTGLAHVNHEEADYDISGFITSYAVGVSGMSGNTQASQNRLTISVEILFDNRLDEKANFKQIFTRMADFPASSQLQIEETKLIESIGNELADDIFNKAFVNW